MLRAIIIIKYIILQSKILDLKRIEFAPIKMGYKHEEDWHLLVIGQYAKNTCKSRVKSEEMRSTVHKYRVNEFYSMHVWHLMSSDVLRFLWVLMQSWEIWSADMSPKRNPLSNIKQLSVQGTGNELINATLALNNLESYNISSQINLKFFPASKNEP